MDDIKYIKKRKALKSALDSNRTRDERRRWLRWVGMLALGSVVLLGVWGLGQQQRAGSLFALRLNSELQQPDDRFFITVSNRAKGGKVKLERIEAGDKNREGALAGGLGRQADKLDQQIAVPKDEQLANDINEGVRLLKEGDINEAIAHFNRVLELDSRSEDGHYNLGIAYSRQGKADQAIFHYKKAIELMPEYVEAYNNLGNLLASQERFDEALSYLATALKIVPNHASAHNNLGTVLARMGRFKEAADHFQEAVRFMPEYAEAHFNLANTWRQLNQLEKAISEYKETLRLKPGFEPAMQALSKTKQSE